MKFPKKDKDEIISIMKAIKYNIIRALEYTIMISFQMTLRMISYGQ